jgi:hypothetical protein
MVESSVDFTKECVMPVKLTVAQIENIISDYYDDGDTDRLRRCAQHLANSLSECRNVSDVENREKGYSGRRVQ